MSPVTSIAASGMRLASASMNAHASNIANLMTEGYQARKVSGVTSVGGGVSASVSVDLTPGARVSDQNAAGAPETRQLSNVNLEDEMIGARLSAFMYAANAAVIYSADAMAGTLLNRMA